MPLISENRAITKQNAEKRRIGQSIIHLEQRHRDRFFRRQATLVNTRENTRVNQPRNSPSVDAVKTSRPSCSDTCFHLAKPASYVLSAFGRNFQILTHQQTSHANTFTKRQVYIFVCNAHFGLISNKLLSIHTSSAARCSATLPQIQPAMRVRPPNDLSKLKSVQRILLHSAHALH